MVKRSTRLFYFFIGTNAELIKLAPIFKELNSRMISFKIITSGQNKIHFDEFSDWIGVVKPDIIFPEKKDKSSVFVFLLWAIKTFSFALFKLRREFKSLDRRKTYFVVHGDTVSALMGSFIAKIYKLQLVHVEGGLYSFNFFEPFPEEISRNIIDRIADIVFPPNQWAKENIRNPKAKKVVTGENTLQESLWWAIGAKSSKSNLERIKSFKKYYILILHRQEHVIFRKEWSKKILEFVLKNANRNLNCILLAHPLTVEIIRSLKIDPALKRKIKMVERIPYPDFMKLIQNAEFIATDGCTNQLEAYYLGTPCLALRDVTEQIEGLGENVVICRSEEDVMRKFLRDYERYRKKAVKPRIRPSKIIVDYFIGR